MGQPARQHKEDQQDAEGGKDDDFHELQAAALQRANSQTVVVPTPSRKNMKEIDVSKLTKSQKNMVLDQVLQVSCRAFGHANSPSACYCIPPAKAPAVAAACQQPNAS